MDHGDKGTDLFGGLVLKILAMRRRSGTLVVIDMRSSVLIGISFIAFTDEVSVTVRIVRRLRFE